MKVKVEIQSIHFDADKKLLEFIQKKMDKLTQFYDRIEGAEVFLKLQNTSTDENKIAEIRLIIPGNDLFAKKQSKTFEEAVDSTTEALRRQIKKHKEKK
jgi:putative sigma-54 modulation protein